LGVFYGRDVKNFGGRGTATMTEVPTEREALLEARVKELEAAAAQRKTAVAGAGIVEQVWHYFTAFVPPWIIACGLAIFLGFHAWEYFNTTQMAAAETHLQKAQAALKDANARAQADTIDAAGQAVPLQTEIAKAEAEKAKQEAAQAQVEADALNAKISGETARLATARAELAVKQAQAEKARAEAEAKTAKAGLLTLEQKAERLKLKQTKLEGVKARGNAALASGVQHSGPRFIQAVCTDNEFAKELGCPARFVREQEEREARTAEPTEKATGTDQQLAAGKFARLNISSLITFRGCTKQSNRDCWELHLPNNLRVKIVQPLENGLVKIGVAREAGGDLVGVMNRKFLRPE
jgi:hypothetical protein